MHQKSWCSNQEFLHYWMVYYWTPLEMLPPWLWTGTSTTNLSGLPERDKCDECFARRFQTLSMGSFSDWCTRWIQKTWEIFHLHQQVTHLVSCDPPVQSIKSFHQPDWYENTGAATKHYLCCGLFYRLLFWLVTTISYFGRLFNGTCLNLKKKNERKKAVSFVSLINDANLKAS